MSNKKKSEQLGMSYGAAANRLRKMILFKLLEEREQNICFQCGGWIKGTDDLSIEHKTPWLDSDDPVSVFFDLDNIAFSHLSCNSKAHRKRDYEPVHGTIWGYQRGCRCGKCKHAKRKDNLKWRGRI